MSVDVRPFAPLYQQTQYGGGAIVQTGQNLVSVTVAASNVAAASAVFPGVGNNNATQIQVANLTDKWAFVNFGVFGSVRAATLTDIPVGPGTTQVFTVPPEVTGASVILTAAAGSLTSVIFTRGTGA
jgi:hypothetical protein